MNKTNSKAFDKIVSVSVSVLLLSALTGFIQKSSADDTLTTGVSEKEGRSNQLAALIEQQKVKIKELRLEQFSTQTTTFSDSDLSDLLEAVGFEGSAVRQAWAVVKKETHGRPLAYNGNITTGDHSYGLFQINMLGGLGVTRRDKYSLRTNNDLFNPVTNAQVAFKMSDGGADWSSWKVGKGYNGADEQAYQEWYNKYENRS